MGSTRAEAFVAGVLATLLCVGVVLVVGAVSYAEGLSELEEKTMHETQFLEVPTDEAVWMNYAAAVLSCNPNPNPRSVAYAADEMLKLHRQRWPNPYKEQNDD